MTFNKWFITHISYFLNLWKIYSTRTYYWSEYYYSYYLAIQWYDFLSFVFFNKKTSLILNNFYAKFNWCRITSLKDFSKLPTDFLNFVIYYLPKREYTAYKNIHIYSLSKYHFKFAD